MLITDHPITSRAHDLLDRNSFVKSLVRTALAYKTKESLVIGLKGAAGSGKSSLLHLIAEELFIATKYSLDEDKPVVMQFDPWLIRDNMEQEFFKQLGNIIQKAEYVPQAKKIGKTIINNYADKDELNTIFASQLHKFVIIIDHINHLADQEQQELIKTIKYLADFPNTIYILALEENQKNISEILHISFSIPSMTRPMLENILLNNLNQAFPVSFYHLFNNIRDVIRYLNMVNFTRGWIEMETNHTDLFIIIALQLFMPEIYQAIRDNKDLFTGFLHAPYPDKGAYLQQEKQRLNAIIGRAKRISADDLRELLTILFPKLDVIYKNKAITITQQNDWRRKNCICDPDTFENFFLLSLPQHRMPEAEAAILLKDISKPEIFSRSIKALIEDNRSLSLFDFYENYLPNKIAAKNIPTAVQALLDCGDLFPPGNINIPPHLHQIIQHLLIKLADEQKFSALQTAINNANMSLYIPVYEILHQTSLPAMQLKTLQNILIEKIEQWGHENRLIEHPHLPEILFAWKTWGAKGNNTSFIAKLIKTDENLIKFILAFLRASVNEFRNNIKRTPKWQQDIDKIAQFIPLEQIEPRIGKIFQDSSRFKSLREREQLAVLIFLDKA